MRRFPPTSDRQTVESIRRRQRASRILASAGLFIGLPMLVVAATYVFWIVEDVFPTFRADPVFEIGFSIGSVVTMAIFGAASLLFISVAPLTGMRRDRLLVEYFNRLDSLTQLESDGSLRPQSWVTPNKTLD